MAAYSTKRFNGRTISNSGADRLTANRNRKHCWIARLLLMIGLTVVRSHVASCCQFPGFVQTNATSSPTSLMTSRDYLSRDAANGAAERSVLLARDWRGRVTDQHTDASQHVTVYGDTMTVKTMGDKLSASSYSRRCVEALGDDRFIVTHVVELQSSSASAAEHVIDSLVHYTCVQFVRRAADVVQLRVGPMSDQPDRNLCSYDVIKLDPWLLVDRGSSAEISPNGTTRRSVQIVGVPCALRGGFGVRMYDRTGHQGACDSRRGETRMENDCERLGDGVYFHFRHTSCVPVGLYMYTTQRTICVANWVAGSFGFTLLRHDKLRYAWLLRYPSSPEESFTAYLFTDLVADTNERIAETTSYIRMDTVRDSPRPATSLCVDEHDVCATWRRPCASGSQMALSCPRTCGVCNASRPAICEFPSEIVGSWYDGGPEAGTIAEFGKTTLTVKSEAGSRLGSLRCIRWNAPVVDQQSEASAGSPSRFRYVFEEMVVTETVDGCRPRYVCVRLLRKSPSIIYFRLSSPRQWPLTSSPSVPIDCRAFNYDFDSSDGDADRYPDIINDDDVSQKRYVGRRRHGFRFLVSREPRGEPVQCRLPGGQLNNYSVTFRCASDTVVDCVGCSTGMCGGAAADCQGTLAESESGTALRLTLSGCSHQTNRTEYNFECRQSSRLVPSKDLVIVVSSTITVATMTPSTTNSTSSDGGGRSRRSSTSPPPLINRTVYHCWAFPSGLPPALSVFYLFDGSECDDAMRVIDFTEGMRIDGGLSRSSSSSFFSSSMSSAFNSPSSLALATFTSKPRRSPREEEDLMSVSVASGSRTVHAMSVLRNNPGNADASAVSSPTMRSQTSTVGATGADKASMTAGSMAFVVSFSLLFQLSQYSNDNLN